MRAWEESPNNPHCLLLRRLFGFVFLICESLVGRGECPPFLLLMRAFAVERSRWEFCCCCGRFCREEVTFFTRACERRDPHSFVRGSKKERAESEREIFLFSSLSPTCFMWWRLSGCRRYRAHIFSGGACLRSSMLRGWEWKQGQSPPAGTQGGGFRRR